MSKIKTRGRVKKYRAAIIGAGRIGSGFDNSRTAAVATHAHAFKNNPRVELVGFFDIQPEKARAAAKKWSVLAYKNLNDLLADKPDLISICTPDADHYPTLLKVLSSKPRLIICEKPLTANIRQARVVAEKIVKMNIPILVNYSRRFDSTIQKCRLDIKKKKYGKVISAVGVYNKGLLHTGSHLIDFARYLFGDVLDCQALNAIFDYHRNDPSVGGWLKLEDCPSLNLVVGDSRYYEIFEMDILLEKARLRFTNFGSVLAVQKIAKDKSYPEFSVLGRPKETAVKLNRAAVGLAGNAVNFLDKKVDLLCAGQDALKTQIVCGDLLKGLKNK